MEVSNKAFFEKIDHKFFNCLYTHIYSYLNSKSIPVELLLYKSLLDPGKVYQHFIDKGQSRWNYFFSMNQEEEGNVVFCKEDMQCIGLSENFVYDSFNFCIDIMQKALRMNNVVFLLVDPFYLPHSDHYQKVHGGHWIMIFEYREATQTVLVLDEKYTFYKFYEYNLKTINESYVNGSQEMLYYTASSTNYDKLKKNYIHFYNTYQPVIDNFFENTIQLLQEQSDFIEGERNSFDQIYHMLNFLAGSILSCRHFLEFINCEKLVIDQISKLSINLENISSVIKKAELTKQINLKHLTKKLFEIKDLFIELISYLKSPSFSQFLAKLSLDQLIKVNQIRISSEYVKVVDDEPSYYTNEYHVDLMSLYNNQGFGWSNSTADLSGDGEYFYLDSSNKLNSFLNWKNIRFCLAPSLGLAEDNVICNEQIIDLKGNNYNSMWILGCGEYGDANGQIVIHYKSGCSETVYIRFTDWLWEPRHGEKIVLTHPIYRREKNDFEPEEGHLFTKRIPLDDSKKISKIQLPFCPNFHIFSITLTS